MFEVPFWPFLEEYGWFVTFGTVLAYFVYSSVVRPKIEEMKKAKQLERQKKFDESVHSRVAESVAAARARQQQDHDAVSIELRRKEEELKEQRLQKLREELGNESVLKSALGSIAVKKAFPPAKKESPAEIIDRYIQSKAVVMFSKSSCPFCRKAKSVLATFRLSPADFEYIELDERDDLPGELIQQEFINRYGSRSVPKVFIAGDLIGGGDDTVQLFQQGVLEVLINQAVQKAQAATKA